MRHHFTPPGVTAIAVLLLTLFAGLAQAGEIAVAATLPTTNTDSSAIKKVKHSPAP